ncbi:hypothetical protein PVK06_005701 [Gossypium arboreum]|uniref:DUF7745 domain-containing protein n=1 Tax=Gossypium arboreum TaxID=29729 RepID=A0ABR0QV99_GOSAR|nr:hypothetical protein PVK06_005701 [Gossypium arboreum]
MSNFCEEIDDYFGDKRALGHYSKSTKGDSKCIPWENLRDLVLTHPDKMKRIDIFALSIYGLVIFPKALRHVDEAVTGLFDRLEKGITPVPAILAETFRSLSMCRKTGEGRFIRCARLLIVWFSWAFLESEQGFLPGLF